MNTVEGKVRVRRRKRQLRTALLLACLGAGLILIGGRIPDPFQLLKRISGINNARFKYQNKRALGRLKEAGLVKFVQEDGKWYARTTKEGKMLLFSKGLQEFMSPERKRKWDQNWRVIVFDISEKRRRVRDRLRRFMESFGFKRLQDSVWVYPYDCEEVLALLKAELKIGSAVLYMVVQEIENDRHLREHFNLPHSD
ncbi:CRISPR-associated endonuclease Cas2 [Candidatus Kaiserbacteria bacterium]|nr:CRISPR-associated endonuclease Cas2 [Candidatus Kaiserbacteria bacterium]